MPARSNPWPFSKRKAPAAPSRKTRRSGLTLVAAARQAKDAGYSGVDFNEWLDRKGLAGRSSGVLSRLGDSYRAGIDARDTDDRRKDDAKAAARNDKFLKQTKARESRERATRVARERGDTRRQKKAIREHEVSASDKREQKKYDLDISALNRHYAKGGTLAEFLRVNPAKLKRGCRPNPAADSAAVYEEFHGRPSGEVVTVKKRVHSHEHLASLGLLTKLVVDGVDGQRHNIEKFKKAMLCANEAKNQLFVEGGDQSVNLEDFGISDPHERERLGALFAIEYHTTKDHLGEEGGEATYTHEFCTTNKNGKHVRVPGARYPDLEYDTVNEQFLISGGSYTIRAEGIDV